ncbi:MAG TPA: hypothetical protein VGG72_09235 [Bryobacteraceae bacterium]
MKRPGFHCLLALAGWLVAVPAYADVTLSGGNSYSETSSYTTSGSSISVSQPSGGLQIVSNLVYSGTTAFAEIGVLNTTLTYNPSTQGAIQSISASVSKNLSINYTAAAGQPPLIDTFYPMIEQDGKYYLAAVSGPSWYGGSTGFLSFSQSGLVASSFSQYDFTTGAFVGGSPNFSGDPMVFGLAQISSLTMTDTLTAVYTGLTFDIVTAAAGPLTVSPSLVSFIGQADSGPAQQQSITLKNLGSASEAFTASVVSGSPWLSISPASGTVTAGASVSITVTVSAQALSAGNYRDVIHIAWPPSGSADIPVTLFAANPGGILWARPVGAVFNVVQGAGSSATQTIRISNQGSAGSTVAWTASAATVSGVPNGNFLSFGAGSGTVAQGTAGSVTLSLNSNAATLGAGVYYELVQVVSAGSLNSPQYVTAILNVLPASASVLPNISPAGLLFTGAVGQTIAQQQFVVNWSSSTYQYVQATATVPAGQSWLQAVTNSSAANAANPAVMTVGVSTSGLGAGVYTGTIDLSTVGSAPIGSVNVTLVLGTISSAPGSAEQVPGHKDSVAGCAPTALALTESSIPNHFSVPAGWPADLVTTMTDDCGNAITGGSVTASFSNGDPPLSLGDQGSGGLYVGTWQPSNQSNSNMTVVLNGSFGKLTPASSQLSGFVTPNQAPVLVPNGILNNLNPLVGGGVAPGTVASAFGSGLTISQNPVSTSTIPLPTAFENTQLVVGGLLAPLYYLSNAQLNVEIPAELAALQQYPAVGVVNNALTLPVQVTVVPAAPGVAAYSDGSVEGEHSDFSLITSSSPAHPGESIIIYLVGMGATNPPVASGAVAPGLNVGDTLASAVVQPVVMVNNQTAQIQFAGLTPGGIGLYQINFVVPANVPAGNLSLTVSQGSTNANTTKLPVAVP